MTIIMFILLILLVNSVFVLRFLTDLVKHKQALKTESGHPLLLATALALIFFLSTLGISDFALSTLFYRKMKLVHDKMLPGTLNVQCVIPVAVMALVYISVIKVDVLTLVVCIIAQIIGAYYGPRFVIKFSANTIKKLMGIGLILASLFILAGKFNLMPHGGTAMALSYYKLVVAALCLFIFGALNNVGIGSYSPTMVTIYALGLNPVAAFPIMMSASACSVSMGSMQFIKYGHYQRKLSLFAAIFGVLGVLLGVYFVNKLDVSMLQWIMAGVLFYSGNRMLLEAFKTLPPTQIWEKNEV